MANYVHYTLEQKERARTTDIADLLNRQGEILKRSGKEYQWRDGSDKVTIRGNLWYHQYEEVGGDAIDFVRKFYNMNYPDAMEYLLNGYGGALSASPAVERKEKSFVLPQKNDNMRRVYAYLLYRRGLDRNVVNAFVQKQMIYESLMGNMMLLWRSADIFRMKLSLLRRLGAMFLRELKTLWFFRNLIFCKYQSSIRCG